MTRLTTITTALLFALLTAVAFTPCTAAIKAPAADNIAYPVTDNVAHHVADNAVGPHGVIHETDITGTVVTGRPVSQPPPPAEGPSFFWASVKMVFALGLVLVILLGISHFMKKYMERFGAGVAAPGRAITVTETRHVAPKTQVMVIEALGARYLIGVTPTQVTLIDKMPGNGLAKAV